MKNGLSKTHCRWLPTSARVTVWYRIPSTYQSSRSLCHSIAKTWKSSETGPGIDVAAADAARRRCSRGRAACRRSRSGSRPTYSIMSISPQPGQPTWPMLLPSAQNAGQSPAPAGTLMRASIRPWPISTLFCEIEARRGVLARAVVAAQRAVALLRPRSRGCPPRRARRSRGCRCSTRARCCPSRRCRWPSRRRSPASSGSSRTTGRRGPRTRRSRPGASRRGRGRAPCCRAARPSAGRRCSGRSTGSAGRRRGSSRCSPRRAGRDERPDRRPRTSGRRRSVPRARARRPWEASQASWPRNSSTQLGRDHLVVAPVRLRAELGVERVAVAERDRARIDVSYVEVRRRRQDRAHDPVVEPAGAGGDLDGGVDRPRHLQHALRRALTRERQRIARQDLGVVERHAGGDLPQVGIGREVVDERGIGSGDGERRK